MAAGDDAEEAVTITSGKAGPVVRFGHAFPHPSDRVADPIKEAGRVLAGVDVIGPRAPTDPGSVGPAERALGISDDKRPVYAFVGCLHPKLGCVGLIVRREWLAREPHGVSRCDTGGLAGRNGGFKYIDEADVESALATLTFAGEAPWEAALFEEVDRVFDNFREYLSGKPPRHDSLDPHRRKCISGVLDAGDELDRRLWTWEVRCFSAIESPDIEAVALTAEAAKCIRAACGEDVPLRIHWLEGRATPSGVHHFEEAAVVHFFECGQT